MSIVVQGHAKHFKIHWTYCEFSDFPIWRLVAHFPIWEVQTVRSRCRKTERHRIIAWSDHPEAARKRLQTRYLELILTSDGIDPTPWIFCFPNYDISAITTSFKNGSPKRNSAEELPRDILQSQAEIAKNGRIRHHIWPIEELLPMTMSLAWRTVGSKRLIIVLLQ